MLLEHHMLSLADDHSRRGRFPSANKRYVMNVDCKHLLLIAWMKLQRVRAYEVFGTV